MTEESTADGEELILFDAEDALSKIHADQIDELRPRWEGGRVVAFEAFRTGSRSEVALGVVSLVDVAALWRREKLKNRGDDVHNG